MLALCACRRGVSLNDEHGESTNRRWKILNKRLMMAAVPIFVLLFTACGRVINPQGWSAGVITDDTIVIGTRQGEVLALDLVSGETRWKFQLESEEKDRGVYGTPALSDDTVFIGGYDGFVYAVVDGERKGKWPEDIDSPIGAIVGSPALVNDLLIVSSTDSYLYALEVQVEDSSGRVSFKKEWEFPTGSKIWSSPTVADDVVYIGSQDHKVYAINVDDGAEIWSFTTGGAVVASPLVEDGRLYVGAFDNIFYALNATTGEEVWRFEGADNWFWGRALIVGDIVYVASLDGNLYALDKNTGEELWTLETDGPIVGSPAVVFDMLAVPSDDGRIRLVKLTDGIEVGACNIGEGVRTSLVVHDGFVYFGAADSSLRSLRIKSSGNPDEEWVHYTDRDDPIPRDEPKKC